ERGAYPGVRLKEKARSAKAHSPATGGSRRRHDPWIQGPRGAANHGADDHGHAVVWRVSSPLAMPQLLGFNRVPIPGPRTRTLPGTLRRLIGFLDDPVGVVLSLREYGELAAVVDQNPAIVCVFGPERVREVLTNPAVFHNPEDFFRGPKGSAR